MVFKEETKSKGWLSWRETPRAGAVLDVEEVPLQLGQSVIRIVDNIQTSHGGTGPYKRGHPGEVGVKFASGQAIDAETWDGINVRKAYRKHTHKDLLGTQVKGAETGRY